MSFSSYLINEGCCKSESCNKSEACCKEEVNEYEDDRIVDDIDEELDEMFADNEGFGTVINEEASKEDEMGEIKTDLPEAEGIEAAKAAADQFVDAVDGDAKDIELSFHNVIEGFSEFGEDVEFEISEETFEEVDPNTIPQYHEEADQYEEIGMDGEPLADETAPKQEVETVEISDENGEESLGESFVGWDDLF